MKKTTKELIKKIEENGCVPKEKDLLFMEKALTNKVWYTRHLCFRDSGKEWEDTTPEIKKGAIEAAKRIEKEYGKEWLLDYKDDFEWGMLNGRWAMVRWMTGGEWEFLDT